SRWCEVRYRHVHRQLPDRPTVELRPSYAGRDCVCLPARAGRSPWPQKYLTTPNRFRKFANILDPGGVSWWLMGLELEVSAKEYRNPHPLLSFRSIPTAT